MVPVYRTLIGSFTPEGISYNKRIVSPRIARTALDDHGVIPPYQRDRVIIEGSTTANDRLNMRSDEELVEDLRDLAHLIKSRLGINALKVVSTAYGTLKALTN